ncbi:acetylglutamate kinase [Aquisalinus flavus]|uniref:Acetylglutamate kinase n=1 Tax=Aquisalinus flavus TaxID=1526572 RepID=A0A8J2Y7X7_9PROT|nr:acetylglutamate kinase [Aquisalinus flavus]MBD0426319.1 acetylglutamate kinase [Aquisalinus flavus]UNE48114.1 acetylglutamate kinase [Aquisalinus flavus]GGD08912.1 acetylglutamate kinase [Aquisalinus flavus]
MTKQTDIRSAIVQLLSSMSGSKEVRTYLQRFSTVEADRFAVIKIGGAIIEEELEATASALAFLHQVGLTPVVIHGGGPQLDKALEARGVTSDKIDGLRVTSPDVLDVARKVFLDQNLKLVEAVRAQGVEAHTLNSGVIEADYLDRDKYGFVGRARGIQQNLIRSVISSGAMPILTCLGVAPGGQIVNINGDAVVAALVHALQPMKIVFLSGVGGLLDEEGKVIDTINLTADYERLMSEPWVHSGMRLKLKEIKQLLDDLPLESSISITRPGELIKELFTHGGSGTYIRQGEAIHLHHGKDRLEGTRICALIEEGFGRTLKADWWGATDIDRAVVSETYRAAALVTKPAGLSYPYLDKFAVAESARGEGLAKAVWQQLCADVPVFFLRSRTENPFNEFYRVNSDGAIKRGRWTMFWKGNVDLATIAGEVEAITALPESFK